MNKYDFAEAVSLVDDDLIEEAEKYSKENISAVSENRKRNNVYWMIPAAAACVALCLAVNHFTSFRNSGRPEISNNAVTESAVTTVSESGQNVPAESTHTDVSKVLQPVIPETLQSSEVTAASSAESVTHMVSENIPVTAYVTEQKPVHVFTEAAVTSGDDTPDVTDAVFTEPEPVFTQEVTAAEVTEEITETTTEDIREGVIDPMGIPVYLLIYGEYNGKLYRSYGDKCRPQDSQLGEEVSVVFREGLYDKYTVTRNAVLCKGEYSDTVFFLKIPGEDTYYLFFDFDISLKEYYSLLENLPVVSE